MTATWNRVIVGKTSQLSNRASLTTGVVIWKETTLFIEGAKSFQPNIIAYRRGSSIHVFKYCLLVLAGVHNLKRCEYVWTCARSLKYHISRDSIILEFVLDVSCWDLRSPKTRTCNKLFYNQIWLTRGSGKERFRKIMLWRSCLSEIKLG